MPQRATTRGADRTSLDGTRADVLICGASFGGLAVARELAGSGANVLLVDRYAIGERATSACAAPTPWLHAMGVAGAIRQELPDMTFTTPHGSSRYRLPWSWSAFDYRELCELLFAQCDARFETAKVQGRTGSTVHTDRGDLHAPLVVDALGWRRVLSEGGGYQPPDAPLSRGLEVHPHHQAPDDALDIWIERSLIRSGYGWRVPASGEQRVGVGSYEPQDHVKQPTVALAGRLDVDAVRYQGNWFPHRLRDATEPGVFFVGDSAGHCFPLSGEGIRTALYFGVACGRELRATHAGAQTAEQALTNYHEFSAGHAGAFRLALCLQRLLPKVPPRLLTVFLRAFGRRGLIDRSFSWYLRQADPAFAGPHATPPPPATPSSGTEPAPLSGRTATLTR